MALIYSRDSKGSKLFSGRLLNISDPDNPEDLSLRNADAYFIQFLSPSGKRYEETAFVNEDGVDGNDDDLDIYYNTTPANPIYSDELGRWAYRVGVRFKNGTVTTSPHFISFWVSI